jgi:diguanylate cyclase (GGDEF)-like protein/PAS domain S-box-containing protein
MRAARAVTVPCNGITARPAAMHNSQTARFDVAGAKERHAGRDAEAMETRFRTTFEQTAVGLTHTDIEGRFLHVNRRFCRLVGYEKAEVLALAPGQLTHPDDRGLQSRGKHRLLNGEVESIQCEKRYLHKDGHAIWVRSTLSLARDEDGGPSYFLGVIEDISDRKEAEDAVLRNHTLLRAVVDNLPDRVYVKDTRGRYLMMNKAAMKVRGIQDHADIVGKTAYDIMPGGVAAGIEAEDQAVIRSRKLIVNRERRTQAKDSRGNASVTRWHTTTKVPLVDAAGQVFGLVGVNRDITEHKRATLAQVESERKFRQLAETIPEIFWLTDVTQRETLYISAAFEKITGRASAPMLHGPAQWLRIVHADDRRHVLESRKALPHSEYNIEYRIVRPDGEVRWIHDQAFPVRDSDNRAYRIAGIAADITQRKLAEEELVRLAHYDALTGLPNRVLFNDRLKQVMAQARRRGECAAVMFLGLDRFKLANDTLGHAVGDQLLRQVAQRLAACLRKVDTVARLSGDEFGVVLGELPDAAQVPAVAKKILDTLAQPFFIDGHELYVTASMGISLYPADAQDETALIKNASAAMVRAKAAGRNNFQCYSAEMNTRTLQRLEMENGLRRAVERREFLLHYQPKVDLASGGIVGFEALLRWQRPANNKGVPLPPGLVSPMEFVPLLEETGLIVPVGEWLIDAACAQIQAWRLAGIEPRPIAINLSARQFNDKNLAATIKRALEVHFVESFLIELEITESSLMYNTEEAIATLQYLKSLGLRISIDDFGTGYSSLSYLKRFPLDALKVDRSFVRDITSNADDAAITSAIISMAHSLGLKVIAEGVETEAQLAFLRKHGCEQMQGYYFSKPVPADDCAVMLREDRRLAAPGPSR